MRSASFRLFMFIFFALFCCLGLGFVACDDDDDDDDTTTDYFPNVDGSTWIYNVTDHEDNTQAEATEVIDGTKNVNGVNCQITKATMSDEPGEELRIYGVDSGSEVHVYGYDLYENGSLTTSLVLPVAFKNLVYPLHVDQTWQIASLTGVKLSDFEVDVESDDFDDDGIDDTMDITITATVKEQVNTTVPAGTFDSFKIESFVQATVHLSQYGDFPMSGVVGVIWFSPGVGIVKEQNYDFTDNSLIETSELKSYSLGS